MAVQCLLAADGDAGHGRRDKIFIHYLYGRPFTVRTDDNALKWLLSFKELKGQVGWRCLERMII